MAHDRKQMADEALAQVEAPLADNGPTEKMREYLEVIYYLAARQEPVISARLAEWMRVTPPTVANIVQRMEKRGYISRDSRGQITLTDEGFVLAEEMVKRHRILERFLVDVLGVPWDKIHEEAVHLERGLTPTMVERIEQLTAHCTTCPHGNPIPGREGAYTGDIQLDQAEPGQELTLCRISEEAEEDVELMRFLYTNQLIPGSSFTVTDRSASFGVTLTRDGQVITLPPQIATYLWCAQR